MLFISRICSSLSISAWFNVVRGLYAGALLFLILDLLYTICYFTCNCCKTYKAVQVVVLDLLVAGKWGLTPPPQCFFHCMVWVFLALPFSFFF